MQPGQRGGRAKRWLEDWAVPHCVWKTRKKNWGTRQTTQPRVPVQGNKASKPLAVKIWGGGGCAAVGETLSLTEEFVGVTHRVLEHTHPPTWESAPEGPNLLMGCGRSD